MNRLLITLCLAGCTTLPAASLTPDTQQAARVEFAAALSQIDGTAREQLTAVKEQTSLLADIKAELQRINTDETGDVPTDPKNGKAVIPESAGETGTTAKDSNEAGSPVLFISYAPPTFVCPPCERLKADIAAGKFSDFTTEVATDWTPPRGYPAIRWQEDGKYKSITGYDANTLPFLKARLLGQKNLVASQEILWTPEPVRQIVVQRMSGPTWTWPGDLASHLSTTHGVDVSGMSFSDLRATHDNLHNGQRGYQAAMPTRRVQYVRRSVSYCPGGNCP